MSIANLEHARNLLVAAGCLTDNEADHVDARIRMLAFASRHVEDVPDIEDDDPEITG